MRAADVHRQLAELSYGLETLLQEYAELNLAKTNADAAYNLAKNKALLMAEGPMDVRKASAAVATAELYLKAQLAEAKWDTCRTALRVQGQRLDAGRTIASTIRAEAIASGVGT